MCDENRLKRKSIPLKDKIEILNRLKDGEKVSFIAKSLNLNECTIRAIKKNEDKIMKSLAEGCSLSAKYVSRAGNNIGTGNCMQHVDEKCVYNDASYLMLDDDENMNIQDLKEHNVLNFDQSKMGLDIQEGERMNESEGAKEIAKTREVIRRKCMAIKTDKIDEDIKYESQYKHIVELLKEIAANTLNSSLENNNNNNDAILVPEKRSKIYRSSHKVINNEVTDDDEVTGSEGQKYKEIIAPLVTSSKMTQTTAGIKKTGKGINTSVPLMTLSNNNIDYDNWDDPNELVDRLRLLISSQQGGNSNHDVEIRTIIRELRDAGYIE